MKHIGKVIQEFRFERDWTLEQLAKFVGVHMATLSRIENSGTPSARTLYKLKKAIPAVEVMCEEERAVVGFAKAELSPDTTLAHSSSRHRLVLNSI